MDDQHTIDTTPLLQDHQVGEESKANGHDHSVSINGGTHEHDEQGGNLNGGRKSSSSDGKGRNKEEQDGSGKTSSGTTPVPLSRLFYFADRLDVLLMIVGGFAACAVGSIMPVFTLIFGSTVNIFASTNDEEAKKAIATNAIHFVMLAGASFVLNFTQNTCLGIAAERQVKKMREQYLAAVLRQEIGWFDVNKTGEITTRIKGDTLIIRQGIGEKLGLFLQFFATFVAGFVIGFTKGWKLALVMLSVVPLLAISAGILFRRVGQLTTKGQKLYAEAGAVAEQSISSIRTVAAFTSELQEAARYRLKLRDAEQVGINSGAAIARGLATVLFIIFASYGLGMWFGSKEIIDSREKDPGCQYNMPPTCSINGGDVLVVFWSVIFGAMSIGQCGPNLAAVAEAKGAAAKLIETVLRTPAIDSSSEEGQKLKNVAGKIELRNIKFRYPSRPDAQIFDDFSLTIEPGQTVALVGGSGSGKSTVVALLERFYDPDEGQILLDGVPIKSLNLRWLRSQMGLVSQEPCLLGTSIAKNIAYSKPGATMEEIVEAAKAANAHNFIMSFPDAYETQVGDMGVQLSGGQKQRVAIARAILRDPHILLLDEATSALDSTSERVVQEALDKLVEAKKRTTIVIAHRLSTIRKADVIVVMQQGKVVESGRHEELMKIDGGVYRTLVGLQTIPGVDEEKGESLPLLPHHHSATRYSEHNISSGDLPEVVVKGKSDDPTTLPPVSRGRLWQLSRPEWRWVVVAVIAATVNGCTFPFYSLLLSSIISVLLEPDNDYVKSQTTIWAPLFVALATLVAICTFTQLYSFTVMGEKLTTRLRDVAFSNTIRQDIAFFDKEENTTGAITARLATEVTLVKSITGQNLGRMVQNVVTVICAFSIAFIAGSWKMCVVLVGVLPLCVLASFLQMKALRENTDKSQDNVARAGTIAVQAISGIRTVTAFGMNIELMDLYSNELRGPELLGIRNGIWRGFALGFSQFILLASYGLLFWYGGQLWLYHNLSFKRMLRSLMAVTMSAQGLGQNTSFLGDQAAANSAAARVFAVVDRKPEIDSSSEDGVKLPAIKGRIELRNVDFTYPSRPEAPIFRNFTLDIEAGTTVALVGASGSGKSTVVSLIERFYDPANGVVRLDGVDLRDLNVKWLRQHIGLVSQEPVLIKGTIAENVAYAKPGASLEEVIDACKAANAHDFITSFPDGYETEVGERGVQLSGGQKQRVSIARAILKNPSILLLDEATSALDSESEVVVQESLDRLVAAKRRTTVVVAHRLSTIRKADKIVVVQAGKVVEQGTHDELMAQPNSQYQLLCRMNK